jgi:hypothetical protein
MSNFKFTAGKATHLANGTIAIIEGVASIDDGHEADFVVEISASDEHRLCSGLCTLGLNDLMTMSEDEFDKVSDLEQEITLAAIAAYWDWSNGTDSVLNEILSLTDSESLSYEWYA